MAQSVSPLSEPDFTLGTLSKVYPKPSRLTLPQTGTPQGCVLSPRLFDT